MSHSAREVERLRKEEAGGDFPIREKAPKEGTYQWTDKKTGEVHTIPKGIDPGWDYNPGKAAEEVWQPDLSKYPPELRRMLNEEIENL